MGTDFPGKTAVLMAIALAPAALRWWWGRRLLPRANDPALAERMVAMARRTGAASGIALVLLVALEPRATAWTLPLLIFGRLVAAYPSRRALFDERWSLAGYLSFWLRLVAGAYGLWISILLLPLIVPLAGTLDWLAAALLGVVLLAWNMRTTQVVRRALRSRPIDDPILSRRFRTMAEVARLGPVSFERVDLHGGSLANAIALPSRRAPAVLFSDPLLATLDENETVAICAHELAHLEYLTPARVRRMQIGNALLIVLGVSIVPVVRLTGTHTHGLATIGWYVLAFAEAAWRARGRQRNETTSDRRAVTLCGDAEALIRGLTRLYTHARVPRRLDPQVERQATHPSLARRIREIRRTAGLTVSPLSGDARFVAPDRATEVTFHPDRLNWSEGESASHSLSYAHLSEVRVTTPHAGPASLVAVELGGRRWAMDLESEDVARAQAVLDVVDGRLAEPPAPPRVRPALARAFALLAALLALPLGHLGAFLLAVIVSLRPSSSLLAGAGLGTLAAAAITIRDQGAAGSRAFLALILTVVGMLLLFVARATRYDPDRPRTWWPISLVIAATVLSLGAMLLDGTDAVSLHQSARALSAPLVFSIGVAGALLWTRNRAAMAGAALGAIAAAGVSVAATSWFLERFGHDPLLAPADAIRVRSLDLQTSGTIPLPFYASSVRVSPGARSMAVAALDDEDDDSLQRGRAFHVGRINGALQAIPANDLRFVDDDRVLALVTVPDGLELRELAVAPPGRMLWVVHVRPLIAPRLSLNRDDMSWRLIGWNLAREIVRIEGQVGDVASRETRWPIGAQSEDYRSAVAVSGDRATAVGSTYDRTTVGFILPPMFSTLPFAMPHMRSTLRVVSTGGHAEVHPSRFGSYCVPDPDFARQLVCSVFDGTDTRVVTLSANGDATSVGIFPGTFMSRDVVGRDWVLGWAGDTPLALRLSTHEAFRIPRARGEWITDVGADGRTFATIGFGKGGSIVRLYSIDGAR